MYFSSFGQSTSRSLVYCAPMGSTAGLDSPANPVGRDRPFSSSFILWRVPAGVHAEWPDWGQPTLAFPGAGMAPGGGLGRSRSGGISQRGEET